MKSLLLFIVWNPSLEAFRVGPFAFRWYSLCWLVGLALAYVVVMRLFRDQKIPDEKFEPLFIYCFLGILVGARLGHCIFYQPEDYLTSFRGFIEMLLPIRFLPDGGWQLTGYEGLASHGGTLGLILALLLYVRRMKLPLWQVLDNIAIATGITACFIRLGNLMNSEIVGSVTNVPWAFIFAARDDLPRHPAQLYEAMAYLLLFVVMLWLYRQERSRGKSKVGTGFYFGLCLTFIFVFRFFVEFLKKEQVAFEQDMVLDMGQLLSIPFVLVGVVCMWRARGRALVLLLLLSAPQAGAQTALGEANLRLGERLQRAGCSVLAVQCYERAADEASSEDSREAASALLHRVDAMKFSDPVEAGRLLGLLARGGADYADLRQKYYALSAFVCFRLGNRADFDKANAAYLESGAGDCDVLLQAMHEALEGYYDQALTTLGRADTDELTRHDVRMMIFEMQGDTAQAYAEALRRACTADSLASAMIDGGMPDEMVQVRELRQAQLADGERTAGRIKLALLLGAVAVAVALGWFFSWRRHRRALEEKNRQLMTALKMAGETEQMKSEFVRRVSHEIRTPLNAITGFNEILNNQEIEVGAEERNELVGRINENVKAITSIVDELLQMANAESVQDYAKNDTVMCNQFFSDLLYKRSGEVSANVELKYTTKVINRFTMQTNAEALQKIVDHLIGNAIKFTQRGIIELNCREEKGTVVLTLTDSGRGIPSDMQDKVFEQFVKADAYQQGIGLGLTVSRSMARRLGGDLVLDKHYTDGARFVLSLPI